MRARWFYHSSVWPCGVIMRSEFSEVDVEISAMRHNEAGNF